jgi:hypothetical protein
MVVDIDGVTCGILAYADDLIALCETKEELQKVLNVCERFGWEACIKFNVKKTFYLVFGNKIQRLERVEFILNGEIIPKAGTIKYLGIVVAGDIKTNIHTEDRISS